MLSNPEFRKNLWLEISPVRLILMPTVLAGVFFVNYLAVGKGFTSEFYASLQNTSLICFGIIVFAWGTKLAADSLVNEFNDRTWDSQRMTSIGPWTMIAGKVFGSTIFVWYGGLICIAVFLFASLFVPDLYKHLNLMMIMIFSGLICHTLSLSLILEEFSKKRHKGKINSSSYLLVMILVLMFIVPFSVRSMSANLDVSWHFIQCAPSTLIFYSAAFFLVWSIVGIYRNMRIELQYTNGPWVWVLFVFSMMIYFSGFVANAERAGGETAIIPALYVSYATGVLITYGMAFIEPKNVVSFRRMYQAFLEQSWKVFQESIPAWLITLAMNVIICTVLIICTIVLADTYKPEPFNTLPLLYPVNLFLFMLRDLSILVYVNLKGTSEKADMAVVFYLMILYILIPLMVTIPGGEGFLPLFVPFPECTFLNGTLPVVIQFGSVAFLLNRRWRIINRNIV
jgi:hypothetical protein